MRRLFSCQVDLASSGAEALAALEREDYALILSDIQMPVINGIEFYWRLRAQHPVHACRLVFITGHPGDRATADDIGAWNVPVIAKPFSLERLAEVCGPLFSLAVAR